MHSLSDHHNDHHHHHNSLSNLGARCYYFCLLQCCGCCVSSSTGAGGGGGGGSTAASGRALKSALRRLLRNRSFCFIAVGYGIMVGVFYGVSTVLGQMMKERFPGDNGAVGWVGFTIVISGVFGSFVCGVILDRTHTYRLLSLILYLGSALCMVAFAVVVRHYGLTTIFEVAALLGFFMTGLLPVGFEFAAEVSFPIPESVSSAVLNVIANLTGVIIISVFSAVVGNKPGSVFVANLAMAGLCLVAFLLLLPVKQRDGRRILERTLSGVV